MSIQNIENAVQSERQIRIKGTYLTKLVLKIRDSTVNLYGEN